LDGHQAESDRRNLQETFQNGPRETPKTSPLLLLIARSQEHYGNPATYLRLKSIAPPSSEPAPARK
jgi:hypothetical protein